jgi:hypothetical protein
MPLQGEELVGNPVSVPARYAEQARAGDGLQPRLTLSVRGAADKAAHLMR